uniref:Uncharacterized protein n=1 Tax=Anopheles culicifacies TaxID=139723 RepID=A0A182LVP5_9DIPT
MKLLPVSGVLMLLGVSVLALSLSGGRTYRVAYFNDVTIGGAGEPISSSGCVITACSWSTSGSLPSNCCWSCSGCVSSPLSPALSSSVLESAELTLNSDSTPSNGSESPPRSNISLSNRSGLNAKLPPPVELIVDDTGADVVGATVVDVEEDNASGRGSFPLLPPLLLLTS